MGAYEAREVALAGQVNAAVPDREQIEEADQALERVVGHVDTERPRRAAQEPDVRRRHTRRAMGQRVRRRLRVCERIPSRRRAADASRRAALLLLAIAYGYDSSSRLARRAPRPSGSVRGFIHKLSRLSGIVAPTVGAIRKWYALNEAIH